MSSNRNNLTTINYLPDGTAVIDPQIIDELYSALQIDSLNQQLEIAIGKGDRQAIQKIAEMVDMRFSKLYISDQFKINLPSAGIVMLLDNERIDLYVVCKSLTHDNKHQALHSNHELFGVTKKVQNLRTHQFKSIKVMSEHKMSCIIDLGLRHNLSLNLDTNSIINNESINLEKMGMGGQVIRKWPASLPVEGWKSSWPVIAKHDESVCLAMEYIKGQELEEVLKSGTLSLDDRYNILFQICSIVDKIHKKGLIHNNIKPSSFIYDDKIKTIHITELSLMQTIEEAAKNSILIGESPEYIAPEIYRGSSKILRSNPYIVNGGPASPQSDIYAVGKVALALLGQDAKNIDKTARAHFDKYEFFVISSYVEDNIIEKRMPLSAVMQDVKLALDDKKLFIAGEIERLQRSSPSNVQELIKIGKMNKVMDYFNMLQGLDTAKYDKLISKYSVLVQT